MDYSSDDCGMVLFLGGSGQRKLNIIPIDSEGYSGRQLRVASNNGKNVLFLIPLQEELETSPLPFSSPEFSKMPKVACNSCSELIPLQMLALHSETCQTAVSCFLCPHVKFHSNF